MTWTAANTKTLTELWPDPSLSCSMIAAELGVTRNMAIGKARRLGLGPKPSDHPKTNTYKLGRAGYPTRTASPPRRTRSVVLDSLPSDPFTPRAADIVPLHLTILQVTNSTCKYGYGDGPFTFCGHPVFEARPYCPAHCRLVYVAPKERSEAQRAHDLRMAARGRKQASEKTRWMAEEAA